MLYAILARGSIILLGLRLTLGLGSEVQGLAQMLGYLVGVPFETKAVWDLWRALNRRRWWQ